MEKALTKMGKHWFRPARKSVSTSQSEGFVLRTTFPLVEKKNISLAEMSKK